MSLNVQGIPVPFPTVGRGAYQRTTRIYRDIVELNLFRGIPDFGRFMARAAEKRGGAALAKTSLMTRRSRDENGYTHGRVCNV